MNLRPYDKVLRIDTGTLCNNKCFFCPKTPEKIRDTLGLVKEINSGYQQKFRRLKFIGGEPTIRKDIIFLVSYAKKIGFKDIRITTNGRMFAYDDFCRKIIDAGLSNIHFSLHGHTASLHDAMCRTQGAYAQLIKGIKNVIRYDKKKIEICVNTTLNSLNYKQLKKMEKMVISLGVSQWALSYMSKTNYMTHKDYKKYAVLFSKIQPFVDKIEISKFDSFTLGCVPLCSLIKKADSITKKDIITCDLLPNQGSLKAKSYSQEGRQYLSACSNCNLKSDCEGVLRCYLKVHGRDRTEKEILQFKKGG